MNRTRTLVVTAWVAALVLLHYSVRPAIGGRVQVDFLVIALLLVSVRARPATAAFVGFAIGVVTDAMTPESFGAGALAMTVVGFVASWLKAVFFSENLWLNAAFVLGGKWAYDVCFLIAERRLGVGAMASQLLVWSPLAALLTAAVGLAVMVASKPSAQVRR
ncbi:MAG: rod shape-determining protein MreD [Gemmatimonadetes bacterium]|nr:rod shape-determining protein MreD [Gemmatimonadota bacterium]